MPYEEQRQKASKLVSVNILHKGIRKRVATPAMMLLIKD